MRWLILAGCGLVATGCSSSSNGDASKPGDAGAASTEASSTSDSGGSNGGDASNAGDSPSSAADFGVFAGFPDGGCGSTATTLVPTRAFSAVSTGGISAAMDLAVNATDLYVAVNSTATAAILRVPFQGGAISTVATLQGIEQGLVLAGTYVVFAESYVAAPGDASSGAIVRVGLDGTDPTVLFTGSIPSGTIFGPAGVLASDGTNVYFAAQDGVRSVPLAGGNAMMLTSHTGAIALVGGNVVVADSTSEGIYSVPTVGGSVSSLATGLAGNLGPVLACGTGVCWASEAAVAPSQPGTEALQQLEPGGTPTTLAQSGALYVVYRMVFDGTDFYATMLADASPGALARIPAGGGTPVVAGGLGSGLAMDDQCIYVGSAVEGVYSVAKSSWNQPPAE